MRTLKRRGVKNHLHLKLRVAHIRKMVGLVKGDLENWCAQAAPYRTWFIQNPAMDVNVFNLLRAA